MIHYHLPGLFEFYDFYQVFLPFFYSHRDFFYEDCDIASIYGAPANCIWSGGRVGLGQTCAKDVFDLMEKYKVSARLTFSNSLLEEKHLRDPDCNELCSVFEKSRIPSGIIIHSDLLMNYLKEHYPSFYYVSSTTKVITDPNLFLKEVQNKDFQYVVPDYRLNKNFTCLNTLEDKDKVEFLCNECCFIGCQERKECYENVSQINLGLNCKEHICHAPGGNKGYRFSLAMKNPSFISLEDIYNIYVPMGFSNFKIEGRGLGSALLLEFILYYMTKPEHHLELREELYLDSMLDLF